MDFFVCCFSWEFLVRSAAVKNIAYFAPLTCSSYIFFFSAMDIVLFCRMGRCCLPRRFPRAGVCVDAFFRWRRLQYESVGVFSIVCCVGEGGITKLSVLITLVGEGILDLVGRLALGVITVELSASISW